jgi:hypothetical protein
VLDELKLSAEGVTRARSCRKGVQEFSSVDPLADVPHSVGLTPYHYAANDPINNIDPDGRDWYSTTDEDGNTSTLWVDSDSDTYTSEDGVSYSNIGTTYSETLSDGTVVSYDQNEVSGTYTPGEQADALSDFSTVQEVFGDEFDIKFEAFDRNDQAAMDEIYKAANWFGVSPGGNLQREEDEDPQIFGPTGPLVPRTSTGSGGDLGSHKKKRGGGKSGRGRHEGQQAYKRYKKKPNFKKNQNQRKGSQKRKNTGRQN